MGAENKILKVSAQLDDSSFRGIVNAVRDIKREVTQAAEALGKLQHMMSSGASPMSVSGAQGPTAGPQPFQGARPTMQAAGGLGSLLGNVGSAATGFLVQGVEKVRSFFGEGVQGANRQANAEREVNQRLQERVKLWQDIQNLQKNGPPPGANETHGQGWGPQGGRREPPGRDFGARLAGAAALFEADIAMRDTIAAHRENRAGQEGAMMRAVGVAGGGGNGPNNPPGPGGGGGGMGPNIPGWIPGAGLINGLRYMAAPAAIGFAAYKAIDYTTNAIGRVRTANTEEALNYQPWYDANLQATNGRVMGQLAVSSLGTDLGQQRAWRKTLEDPNVLKLMSSESTDRRLELAFGKLGMMAGVDYRTGKDRASAMGATPGTVMTDVLQKTETGVAKFFKNVVGEGGKVFADKVEKAGDAISKIPTTFGLTPPPGLLGAGFGYGAGIIRTQSGPRSEADTESAKDIGSRRANAQAPIEKLQDLAKAQSMKYESEAVFNAIQSQLVGGAFGKMNLLRQAGMGYAARMDPKTGKIVGYSGDDWIARVQARGFDPGEAAGMRAHVGRVAGRGNMTERFLEAQAGGFHNVNDVFGLGARVTPGGQGNADAFYKAVQAAQGSGGFDVTAGSDLAGIIAQMAQGNTVGIGADRTFAAMAGAAYNPNQTPAQQTRSAQLMGGGMKFIGDLTGGRIDPLSQAVSFQSALAGAGDLGIYAAETIHKIMGNPAEMTEILQGGELSPDLKGLGLTREHFQKAFEKNQVMNALEIVQGGLNKDTPGGAFASRVIASGGNLRGARDSLLKDRMGDEFDELTRLRSKKNKTQADVARLNKLEGVAISSTEKEIGGYARIQSVALGQDFNAVRSGIEGLMNADDPFGRRAHGKGAHGPGMGILKTVGAKAHALATEATSEETGTQEPKLLEEIREKKSFRDRVRGAPDWAGGVGGTDLGQIEMKLNATIGVLNGGVEQFYKSLVELSKRLDKIKR